MSSAMQRACTKQALLILAPKRSAYAFTAVVTAVITAAVTVGRIDGFTAGCIAACTAGVTAGRMDGLFFATIAFVAADFLTSRDFFGTDIVISFSVALRACLGACTNT